MAFTPESDEALVMRLLPAANADLGARDAAWDDVHARYAVPLWRFIRQSVPSEELGQEIYQDTMMTAFMNLEADRYEYTGVPFGAYLKGIARNKIYAAQRDTSRYVELDDEMPLSLDDDEADWRGPEHSTQAREQLDAVLNAIGQLSDKTGQVLMGVLEGKTFAELADELGMTEEAIRQHKSRGVRSLQQMGLY